MGGNQLLVIGVSHSVLQKDSVKRVMALWHVENPPIVRVATFAEAMEPGPVLNKCSLVWVMPDGQHGEYDLFELLAHLQERHLPILLTPDTEKNGGPATALLDTVVSVSAKAPTGEIIAALQSLWCASKLMRSMDMELRLMELHQGGLCDQIDKIDEELRLAAQLQQEFLPRELPNVRELAFGVLYRPAGYVSGDIYDIERLDEDHIGVFIADAVGHGVPAALMTMYIKRSLQTRRLDRALTHGYEILSPDEALAKLNRDMLSQQSGKVRFATACYCVINLRTLELHLARAGHPFPMVLRANGTTLTPQPDGPLLGVFPDVEFELASLQLAPGDRLLMYSDGFELAFPASKANGGKLDINAYRAKFAALATGTLEQAMGRLEKTLDEASGSLHQRDDMTAVIVAVANGKPGHEAAASVDEQAA